MIVDSSALMSILDSEPDAERFAAALAASPATSMSVATWVETAVVVDARGGPPLGRTFDRLVESAGIDVVPLTNAQGALARQAYRDFGKGTGHPARLNLGDCFAYALASDTREPLLFKGDDFVHTDVTPAISDTA